MSIVSTKEDIYDIMARFEKSSCSEIYLSENGISVKLTKGYSSVENHETEDIRVLEKVSYFSREDEKSLGGKKENKDESENKNLVKVKSPIVGVFYSSPKPDDEPYVNQGTKVKKGDVLCLVEAMKMMNELKSPVDGIVKNIYGNNGKLAEFDEVLFEVEEC